MRLLIKRVPPNIIMKELKAIDPMSLGKVLAILMAVFGFISGLFAAAGMGYATSYIAGPIGGAAVGILAIIVFPVVFAILGFIAGIITAFVYNIIAKRFGGVMLDL
jgi:hypothetical protein